MKHNKIVGWIFMGLSLAASFSIAVAAVWPSPFFTSGHWALICLLCMRIIQHQIDR